MKWYYFDDEVNIIHTIEVFNFSKVEMIETGSIYYVDNSLLKTYPRTKEQAISLALLGGRSYGYNACSC